MDAANEHQFCTVDVSAVTDVAPTGTAERATNTEHVGHQRHSTSSGGHRPLEVVFQNLSVSIALPPQPLTDKRSPLSWPLKKSKASGVLPTMTRPEPLPEKKNILSDVSGYARPGQMLGKQRAQLTFCLT